MRIALGIFLIIFDICLNFLPEFVSHRTFWPYEIIYGAWFSVVASTSSVATLIIAYQIYSVTEKSTRHRDYWHIVEIIVQSVCVYSALMLAEAVCSLLNTVSLYAYPKAAFVEDFLLVLAVTSGVSYFLKFRWRKILTLKICPTNKAAAPTLMVARLSLASKENMEYSSFDTLSELHAELDIGPEGDLLITTNGIIGILHQGVKPTSSRNNIV